MSNIAGPAAPQDTKLAEFQAVLAPQLQGSLRIDSMSRALYATDASMYQRLPLAVLIPKSNDDVQAAVAEASRFKIPVLPRGGGSSLAGQTVNEALVIDFSLHLNRLLEMNREEKTVRVQPGLVLDQLNGALLPHGLMVGPDPASSNRATVGGMVGNNATGTHSILYRNVIDHLKSLDVILNDGSPARFETMSDADWRRGCSDGGREGEIFRALDDLLASSADVIASDTPGHWRRNSGYRLEQLLEPSERNVARLLCGSEGTLAVTTEIEISVVDRPQKTALAVVHFHSMREALESVTTILETHPSAVELFDGIAIEQTRRAPGFAHRLTFIDGEPGAVLITEYYGDADQELTARIDDLKRALERSGHGYAVVPARTPIEISNVWTVRKEGLGLIMGVEGDHKPMPFIEDASVPVEHLPEYVTELQTALSGTRTVYYAHASAGTLHIRPFINTKDAGEVEKMRDIAKASMELVRKYGGAVSSEHGDGIARSWLLEPLVGKALYDVYVGVKDAFDPERLLNPGNVVEAPPMTEHLRMGPRYATIPIVEELDFSGSGGFAGAVELCNGNGACRKLDSGTMCPSFMVTREEADSTRGRANALRMALSGALPPEELTGRQMYDVMDLCIQCKGCKTECPSNVDMAKLKTEWLSKYWEANGLPLRARFFTRMPRIARRLAGPTARAANWMNRRRAIRSLLERTMGISQKRELPSFAEEPFSTWFTKQTWTTDGPPVVLFADTFNNYNHPETARAAAEFLNRIGFSVRVAEPRLCCGRPHLSKGLVREAQAQAMQVVDALHQDAANGIPIIGLEPSCILTFRDEFLSLLPGDTRAVELADVSVTFEEFVTHLHRTDALSDVQWTRDERDVLLHGHCHQKALVGTGPSEICLSIPPNYNVQTVDSGCCGMAGSFGYEVEHYDISIAMAERRLAPAVRASSPETIIAAPGTSCRAQIHDTTGRKALHPAEILRDALVWGR
jgi:FAD/FMN-containing dehydrogenase/Fe-S oxidoreductase